MLRKLFVFCLLIINCVATPKTNEPKQLTPEEKIEALFSNLDNSETGNQLIFNSIRARLAEITASIEAEKWSCMSGNWQNCAKKWELICQSQGARKDISRLQQQIKKTEKNALLELDMYLQSKNYSNQEKVKFLEELLEKTSENNRKKLEDPYKKSVYGFATEEHRRECEEVFTKKKRRE